MEISFWKENILPVFYFAVKTKQQKKTAEKFIGIDFAMQGMCVFSTGKRAEYPMFYRNTEKSLHGNRESCPDVRKAVRIIRSRRKELHCAMKRSEIREKIFSINSVPVLPGALMQYVWKIWIWKGWQEDFILEKVYMIMDMACFCLCWNINWRNEENIWSK